MAARMAKNGDRRDQHPRPVGDRRRPAVGRVDAEQRLLDEVGHVELGDVDPPLLRQLDEDPDARRERITVHLPMRSVFQPRRTSSHEEEEVLERVREDEQDGPVLRELERHDADHAVVVQELAHPERALVGPVAQRGEVGDREVVDVERLVVGLVAVQRDGGELLEDALVDRVEDEAREESGHREVRDEQRQRQASADHEDDDGPFSDAHVSPPPPSAARGRGRGSRP